MNKKKLTPLTAYSTNNVSDKVYPIWLNRYWIAKVNKTKVYTGKNTAILPIQIAGYRWRVWLNRRKCHGRTMKNVKSTRYSAKRRMFRPFEDDGCGLLVSIVACLFTDMIWWRSLLFFCEKGRRLIILCESRCSIGKSILKLAVPVVSRSAMHLKICYKNDFVSGYI